MERILRIIALLLAAYVGLVLLVALLQRSLIYYPPQIPTAVLAGLAAERQMLPWTNAAGRRIGWQRPASIQPSAGAALILHGNAGSAVARDYLADPLQAAWPLDVFILEYPGYADRPGKPSQSTLLAAADEAAELLADRPPLFLIGESLGTGPAAYLAGRLGARVAGVLLLVPYNRLADVAAGHYPWLPVRWLLRDPFPADEWLATYPGPVGFLIAERDQVIPPKLGRALHDGFAGRKQLWVLPEADHEEANDRPPEWWEEVGRFWGVEPSDSTGPDSNPNTDGAGGK